MSVLAVTLPLAVFGFLVFILLIGPLPRCRGTWLERSYWWLTEDLPTWAGNLTVRLCGNRAAGLASRCVDLSFNTGHPFFQVLFVALFVGGLLIFMIFGWHHVPGPYLSAWHCLFIPVVIMVPIYTYVKSCSTDPGRIAEDNAPEAYRLFPYDLIIFDPYRCRTCHTIKPARSKHCSLCNACIAGMDHHCVWINNCVGHNNYRYFISFLISMVFLSAYGSYVMANIFRGVRKAEGLDTAWVWDPDLKRQVPVGWFQSYQLVLAAEPLVGALGILLALITPALGAFLAYALYVTIQGATANECDKWNDLDDWIRDGGAYWIPVTPPHAAFVRALDPTRAELPTRRIFIADAATARWLVRRDQDTTLQPNSGTSDSLNDGEEVGQRPVVTLPEGVAPEDAAMIRSLEDVDNLYDRGWWENLRWALWGPRLSPTQLTKPKDS
ncbi:hypothetical protein IWQ60_005257 [Tieghemiomyces parasiticus]|uniref:Palmitoyltransferase n=1 Tax=Tieghemiomyces parasiticus TaxID=78921 RepID=A0A9W8DYE0_9FUNG|nr:hypothetical protein IWQ60_005257 [Tieghemiomyces parasiticus]